MLSFCTILFVLSFCFSSSLVQVIVSSSAFIYYFLTSSSCFHSITLFNFDFISDEFSILLSYLSVFVICSSSFFCFVYFSYSLLVSILLISILFICVLFFSSSNLLVLYIMYEMSLLPIVYIIVKFGSYPDRSYSALMLFIYTSVFTLPFILVVFSVFESSSTLHFYFYSVSTFTSTTFISIFTLLAFSVNLPVYGLHFWLPIAHVEAPTFGSIILAGVLLNLGGLGLIRLSPIFDSFNLMFVVPLSLVLILYVTLVCCFQSDFNRLVAYSSVSHISIIPALVLTLSPLGFNSSLLIMFFHGLSSPIIFMLVSLVYDLFSTRQLVLISGLVTISPILSLFIVLTFFFTLSAPPFPSFVGEVLAFTSVLPISYISIPILLLFAFLSLLYNLNWLSSISFFSSNVFNPSFNLQYISFVPLVSSLFLSVLMLLVFSSF